MTRPVLAMLAVLISLIGTSARAETCATYPYETIPEAVETLHAAFTLIDAELPALTRAVHAMKPPLCLIQGPAEALGTYDPGTFAIAVEDTTDAGRVTAILLHELRHLDQTWRGACLSPDLAMRDHARAVFALEADAMAITMLAAWRLSEAGEPAPFQSLTAMRETSDIAAAFSDAITSGEDDVAATAAAFSAWYGSEERREKYYVATCEGYLSALEDSKRLPSYATLDHGFLSDVCRLPSGDSYPCDEPTPAVPRGD